MKRLSAKYVIKYSIPPALEIRICTITKVKQDIVVNNVGRTFLLHQCCRIIKANILLEKGIHGGSLDANTELVTAGT